MRQRKRDSGRDWVVPSMTQPWRKTSKRPHVGDVVRLRADYAKHTGFVYGRITQVDKQPGGGYSLYVEGRHVDGPWFVAKTAYRVVGHDRRRP